MIEADIGLGLSGLLSEIFVGLVEEASESVGVGQLEEDKCQK